jgi:hypothetical protein
MAIARVHLVDPLFSRWCQCIIRSVRRARLLGEGMDRKEWIEHRLKELADIFGIAAGGFAVLDNHLPLLVRRDPETVKNWSDEEVIRRWARLFPPRDKIRRPLGVSDDWVKGRLLNAACGCARGARARGPFWTMIQVHDLAPDPGETGHDPACGHSGRGGVVMWAVVQHRVAHRRAPQRGHRLLSRAHFGLPPLLGLAFGLDQFGQRVPMHRVRLLA